MQSKIIYNNTEEYIVDVSKEIEIISAYNNSVYDGNKELFEKAYYFLIDYYTKKLLELKPELKDSEQLIFEGFYQNDENFVNVVNFERL